jgi:3-oxoacyl-[acyl-carrier-protein] synthase-1
MAGMTRKVYLQNGYALCAAGNDAAARLQSLRHGTATAAIKKSLPAFVDRPVIPYFLIDSAVDTQHSIAAMVRQLTGDNAQTTALLLGSTSFDIDANEENYRQALQDNAGEAVPMPAPGYRRLLDAIASELQLRGPRLAFNTACTAGANALLTAHALIANGVVKRAVIIGIERYNLTTAAGFCGLQLLSDDTLRPFDRERSGIVLGETISCLLLDDTPSDIELAGGATACDSHSVTGSNPDGSTIADVMQQALRHAGSNIGNVRGIKAHGTASPANDAAESAGLRKLFTSMPPITALKGHIGHTLGACGVLETLLCAEALRAGFWPATAGFRNQCDELGIQPLTTSVAAAAGDYLLNFFGFGGSNCALVLRFGVEAAR